MQIYKIKVGINTGIETNCYIVEENKKCFIVDPGDEGDKIKNFIRDKKLNPEFIVCTHCHIDHVKDVYFLQESYKIPVFIHPQESVIYEKWNLANLMGIQFTKFEYQLIGEEIYLDRIKFDIIHTPGHTPGSIIIVQKEARVIFSGDLLFKDGVGRTDFPGGNENQLVNSLKNLFRFPDNFTVYPGHGEITTLGKERNNIELILKSFF